MVERSFEMIAGLLGILKAGAAYLPLDFDYPPERRKFMLEDSGAALLLTRAQQNDMTGFAGEIIDLESSDYRAGDAGLPAPGGSSGQSAYIIYTSGSTGKPKGTLIRHRSIVNTLYWRKRYYRFDERDVVLQLPSFSFDSSVEDIFNPLISSSKLLLIQQEERFDTKRLGQLLSDHAVTHFLIIPNLYNAFLEEIPGHLQGLTRVTAAGESFTPDLVRRHFEHIPHVELYNEYGPTENSVCATVYRFIPGRCDVLIGKPIANVNCWVLGANGELSPIGVPGELCLSGASLAAGYWNNDRLTGEKFVSHPFKPGERMYKTGDLVRWQPDGNLEFLGRLDNQVKIRGFRIELGEIESRLSAHDAVREAVVLAREASGGKKSLCAYLVTEGELDWAAVKNYLAQGLPDYMVPSQFCTLERMPLTPGGKIDRQALSRVTGVGGDDIEYAAPRGEVEEKMAAIWAKVLEVDRIGINDNYFNRGGDSIKAIKLLSLINAEFAADLKIVDLFTAGTIEQLAARLSDAGDGEGGEALAQVLEEIQTLKRHIMSRKTFPGEIEDIYPMSDIEKGMVFHSLKDSAAAVFHNQLVHQVKISAFDSRVFEQALALMVEKHPILRTTFIMDEFDEAVQAVHKTMTIDYRHYDISGRDHGSQEAFIANLLADDRRHPFNIDSYDPLWRVRTFTLDDETLCLVWIGHHAILDGWSSASLLTELNNAYFSLRSTGRYHAGALKSSYKDFVIQQRVTGNNTETGAYWKRELAGYRRLEFPAPGGAAAGDRIGEMKKYEFQLARTLLEQLKQTADAYETNLKCLCFGAYLYMLNMLSYENDVTAGLVTNNRPVCEDGDRVLGCFLSTIPVRLRIPPALKVSEYIKMVDEKLLELTRYGTMSLFDIVRIIGEGPGNRNPIFDAMFNYMDFHVFDNLQHEQDQAGPLEKAGGPLGVKGTGNANLLFNFNLDLTMGSLHILLYYASGSISEALARSLCGCFQRVLEKMALHTGDILEKEALLSVDDAVIRDFLAEEAARRYWKNYLDSYGEPALIPGKKVLDQKAGRGEPRLEEVALVLENEVHGLNDYRARHRASLATVCQGAWGILSSLYNDRRDVVFGRAVVDNIVPVRVCWEPGTAVKDLLQTIERDAAASASHCGYPLAAIQEQWAPGRHLLDQVFVSGGNGRDMTGAGCDFYIVAIDSGASLEILFRYDGRYYERELLERVASDYRGILRRMLENERLKIVDIKLESEASALKKADIRVDFNI
jgi:amino acid adenylation domain-containing protein